MLKLLCIPWGCSTHYVGSASFSVHLQSSLFFTLSSIFTQIIFYKPILLLFITFSCILSSLILSIWSTHVNIEDFITLTLSSNYLIYFMIILNSPSLHLSLGNISTFYIFSFHKYVGYSSHVLYCQFPQIYSLFYNWPITNVL